MSEKNVFSKEGYAYYRKKIAASRGEIADSGKNVGEAAGENCDWHDNFAFDDAMRKLEMVSIRAVDLQRSLDGAEVIDVIEQSVRVAIGNTVEIEFDDGGKREITIGAWGESDPLKGLISYSAPLARAVIGKKEGDEGRLKKVFTINKIHPASYKYRELIRALFADMDTPAST